MGKSEDFRLEMSEARETITLKKLAPRRAEAMGCELVYAVVPRQGTLEDLAGALETERRKHKRGRREEALGKRPYGFLKTLDTVLALRGGIAPGRPLEVCW